MLPKRYRIIYFFLLPRMSSHSRIVFPVSRTLLPYLCSTSILSILQEPSEILPLFLKHAESPQPNTILAPVFRSILVEIREYSLISFFSYYLPYYSDNLKGKKWIWSSAAYLMLHIVCIQIYLWIELKISNKCQVIKK